MAQCEPDPGIKGGPHVLRQSGRRLRDSDLVRIREQGSGYDEIDLSRNDLTSKSVPDIVHICKKSQQLRILKLFNNRLGDDGAEELGEIFQHCAYIEEVHLSHNDFTRKGVEILVLAADRGLPKDVKRPLWLRMEHNKVSDTEGFARDLERDCPAVCGREDRHRCTPRVCAKGRRIHLPFLIEAPKGRGRGKEGWGPGGAGPRRERRDSRRRPRAPMRRRSEAKESRSRSARRRPRTPADRQEPSCRLRLRSAPRGGRGGRRASSSRERLPQTPPRRPQLYMMRRERVRLPPPRLSRSHHAVRDLSQRVAKPKSRQCAAYPSQRLNGHNRRPQPPQAHVVVTRRVLPYTPRQFVPASGVRDDVEYSYYSYYSEYEDEGSCA